MVSNEDPVTEESATIEDPSSAAYAPSQAVAFMPYAVDFEYTYTVDPAPQSSILATSFLSESAGISLLSLLDPGEDDAEFL